jgi:hypothetical protein
MKGKAKIPSFTHERVLEALEYNPATGVFVWKIRIAYNVYPGQVAGGDAKGNGYAYVRLDGEEVTCARLAIFYMTGEWPERRVRFKNGDKSDCRYDNLTQFNGLAGEFDHKTREGRQAYQNAYRKLVPQTEKARGLREKFDLTLEQFEEMNNRQNGKCAICGNPETQMRDGKVKTLAVDHRHHPWKIRGLLCSDCNTGIGKLKENYGTLLSSIAYLFKHEDDEDKAVVKEQLQEGVKNLMALFDS